MIFFFFTWVLNNCYSVFQIVLFSLLGCPTQFAFFHGKTHSCLSWWTKHLYASRLPPGAVLCLQSYFWCLLSKTHGRVKPRTLLPMRSTFYLSANGVFSSLKQAHSSAPVSKTSVKLRGCNHSPEWENIARVPGHPWSSPSIFCWFLAWSHQWGTS